MIRIFVLLSLLLGASAIAAEKPNFIFILSDDLAQGDLGCYGQKLIQTPRIDSMAEQGTRYLQAYCGTTVCAPSRASFFTGLHSGHSPIRGNYELPPEGQLPIPAETVTIAEVAKAAGYATATFGKWGMGFFRVRNKPWAFWDLMPTFTTLSGATPPKGYETDGLCLVDFLKGGAAPKREYFYWELHEGKSAARAARWGDWKAVLTAFGKPVQIYDLAKDSGETTDLAKDHPELVKRAEAIFADAHRPNPNWPLDHRSVDRLRHTEETRKATAERNRSGWLPPNVGAQP